MIQRLFGRHAPKRVDVFIALGLFVSASVGSMLYWRSIIKRGPQPFYYQLYFEPAVMVACGKGFVVARPQVPEMVPFLWRQAERFDCAAIPANAPLGTEDLYQQGSWRYFLTTVGYTWRVFGVAWDALGPLFGVLFGSTIAIAYVIFRIGMGPLLALAGAAALSFSELHIKFLFVLRDYAKAPFTLALIALLGMLVVGTLSWRRTMVIAAAYGVVLGIGYGFRTDFLIDVPPIVLALLLFMPGGLLRNLPLKLTAIAVCVGAFYAVGWPVISTQEQSRSGCQPHVIQLGFASLFDAPLGVLPAPYEVSREYLDEYAFTTVSSYARRAKLPGPVVFCEPSHGRVTWAFLREVVRRFPADILVRAYASVLRIVELPFSPVPGHDDGSGREPDWAAGHGIGLALVAAAIVLLLIADWRLGVFAFGFLLYFGGFPAIQFDHRHFFHLEFVMWWSALFIVQVIITDAAAFIRLHQATVTRRAAVAGATIALFMATMAAALWVARSYQQQNARPFFDAYVAAPREIIPATKLLSDDQGVRVSRHADPEIADFIVVDVNRSRCSATSSVAFRYADPARRPYSRVFPIPRDATPGITEIFMPIYDGFGRLDFADAPEGCIDSVGRVRDGNQFAMMVEAVLPPAWRRAPLYQRFGD